MTKGKRKGGLKLPRYSSNSLNTFEYQQQLMKLQAEQEVLTRERQRDETMEKRRKDALAAALPNFKEIVQQPNAIYLAIPVSSDNFFFCGLHTFWMY